MKKNTEIIEAKYQELMHQGVDQFEAALTAIGIKPDLAKEGATTIRKHINEA